MCAHESAVFVIVIILTWECVENRRHKSWDFFFNKDDRKSGKKKRVHYLCQNITLYSLPYYMGVHLCSVRYIWWVSLVHKSTFFFFLFASIESTMNDFLSFFFTWCEHFKKTLSTTTRKYRSFWIHSIGVRFMEIRDFYLGIKFYYFYMFIDKLYNKYMV